MKLPGVIACLVVGAAFMGTIYAGCEALFGGMCSNEVFSTVSSPDGTLKVVSFDRGCGATTGGSTQISVLPTGTKLPSDGGNLFIADTNHGAAPYRKGGGGPEVAVRWKDNRTLLLRYHWKTRVFYAEKQVTVKTGWFSHETVNARYETATE